MSELQNAFWCSHGEIMICSYIWTILDKCKETKSDRYKKHILWNDQKENICSGLQISPEALYMYFFKMLDRCDKNPHRYT